MMRLMQWLGWTTDKPVSPELREARRDKELALLDHERRLKCVLQKITQLSNETAMSERYHYLDDD